MDERRKQPRKDLMSYSQVFDLYNGKLIGYLGDLNQLGAMVIAEDLSRRLESVFKVMEKHQTARASKEII